LRVVEGEDDNEEEKGRDGLKVNERSALLGRGWRDYERKVK
jgi:hypothetical protein